MAEDIKDPSYPHYAWEWVAETFDMDPAARGILVTLRSHYWIRGTLPTADLLLARAGNCTPRELRKAWPAISRFFEHAQAMPSSIDTLRIPDLDKVRSERESYRERQSNKAKERWAKDAAASSRHMPDGMPAACSAFASASASALALVIPEESRSEEAPATATPTQAALPGIPPPPPKPAKPPKAKPKAGRERWSEILAAYHDGWIRHRSGDGKGPVIAGADRRALAAVYDEHGPDETLALVERFVLDDDPLLGRRGHMLRDLPSRRNAYRSQANGHGRTTGAAPAHDWGDPERFAPDTWAAKERK